MKGIAAALAATAVVALAPAAQAATTIASVNTDTSADGSFTTTFSDANMMAGAGGLFTATLDFTTLAGILGIRVDTSSNYAGGPNDTDITRVFLTGSSFGGEFDIFPAPYSTDVDEVYRLFQFPVDAGSYTLTVQGTPALENSGFTGQIIFSAGDIPNPSAVPEPATWLMLMSGLGVIGFAMRRRGEGQGTPNVRFTMA